MNSVNNRFRLILLILLCLTLSSCGGGGGGSTSVQTTPAVMPSTTKVLDSTSVTNLSTISSDGSQLTFSGTTSQINSLSVGDVVASGITSSTPSGLLKKVSSINQSGNQVIINTSNVTLEESIKSGTWSITQSLGANQVVKAVKAANGVTLNDSTSLGTFTVSLNDTVLYDKDGNLNTTNDQIVVNGSITIEPSYTFSGSIDSFKLKQLTFTNTTKETCTISLSSNEAITNYSKSFQIAEFSMPSVTIWIGEFPLVITPVLTVNVGLTGNVSVGISTGITQTASFTNGLSYDENSGWSAIKSQDKSFQFDPPTIYAAATAKCFAGPKIELLLYGSAGPYASADGYLELDADPSSNPWWTLYGGIEASAGVELTILSHLVASYSANIFDERQTLAQATKAAQISPTITQSVSIGPPGTTFPQSGNGFSPSSTATIHVKKPDGTEYPTSSQSIDANGAFSISYVSPSNKPAGTYTWWAVDGPTGQVSNILSYTITQSSSPNIAPAIIQNPLSGPAGTTFTQSGSGFSPNSTSTLHFKKPDGTEYPTSSQSIDANGAFSTSYASPTNKPAGIYTWWAVDGPTGKVSNTVSYTITINTAIAQTPMSGPAGTSFAQWGTGFSPNSNAVLHFKKPDGTEYPTSSQPIDGNGTFSISYVSPTNKPAGTYSWWAVDGPTGQVSNTVTYTITINPTIAQTPMSGPAGTSFSQWGTGFSPNSSATLHFLKPDGTEYPTSSQSIDGNGTFSITYASPSNKPSGTYKWWSVDGPSGKSSNTVSYTIQ